VHVQIAANVLQRQQVVGHRPRLELVTIFAQLRRNPRQIERRVNILLGPRRDDLLALGEPVLVEAPTAFHRQLAQPHVVLLAAGEVLPRGPERFRGHDAQVHLHGSPAWRRDKDGALRSAGAEHLHHTRQFRELPDDRLAIRRDAQQIEVADRLAATTQRAGGLDARDALHFGEGRAQLIRDGPAFAEARAAGAAFEKLDPACDLLDALGPETFEPVEPAGLDRGLQVGHRRDAAFLPEQGDLLRPDRRDRQQREQRLRHRGGQLVAHRDPAGVEQLLDLLRRALAHTRQRCQLTACGHVMDVRCEVFECARHTPIRIHAKGIGPLNLEQIGDLGERAGDVGIGHEAAPRASDRPPWL